MTAKEYLKVYRNAMDYYDEISMVIDELYEMRHNKGMTENYFEHILQQDIRFDRFEDEHKEWENLGGKYGWAGLVKPEYKPNDGEIDRYDAMNVRVELIEVIREDKSFGYLFNLLSKDKDSRFYPKYRKYECSLKFCSCKKLKDIKIGTFFEIAKKYDVYPY